MTCLYMSLQWLLHAFTNFLRHVRSFFWPVFMFHHVSSCFIMFHHVSSRFIMFHHVSSTSRTRQKMDKQTKQEELDMSRVDTKSHKQHWQATSKGLQLFIDVFSCPINTHWLFTTVLRYQVWTEFFRCTVFFPLY